SSNALDLPLVDLFLGGLLVVGFVLGVGLFGFAVLGFVFVVGLGDFGALGLRLRRRPKVLAQSGPAGQDDRTKNESQEEVFLLHSCILSYSSLKRKRRNIDFAYASGSDSNHHRPSRRRSPRKF